MIKVQKRLGKDVFPLVEQTYFPNQREMVLAQKRFSSTCAYSTIFIKDQVHPCSGSSTFLWFSNFRLLLLVLQSSSTTTRFPCVFKIGHAHGGTGKVRVENAQQFQDLISVITLSDSYCTVEPYIEAKFDLHVQKIGCNYKAWM